MLWAFRWKHKRRIYKREKVCKFFMCVCVWESERKLNKSAYSSTYHSSSSVLSIFLYFFLHLEDSTTCLMCHYMSCLWENINCLPCEIFRLKESQLPWIELFFSLATKSAELSFDVRVFGASNMCLGASSPRRCE